MKQVSFTFSALIVMIAVLISGVHQETSLAQDDNLVGDLIIDVENAAVWHGDDWDDKYTDPGAVLYHDGQFHMLRNGFRNWPASVEIAYTTSEDGITWEKQGEDPVLYTDDVPYAGTAALASSLLVEDDGTWVLYFYTWPPAGSSTVVGGVGRATAPAPEGPWTPDDALVLEPGDETDWDTGQLISPSVVKIDDTYLMYYHVANGNGRTMIGMATSEDGIVWEKYDDPETTDELFANSDPVLQPNDDTEAWDGAHVNQPRVVATDDGLVMLYRSWTGAQQNQSIGFAISDDGVMWERLNEEPIFDTSDIARRRIWFTELAYDGENYFIYLELQRGYQSQTDIYAGIYAGEID